MSPECKDRDQHGLVRNGFPNNKRLCNRIRKRVCHVMVVRVCLSGPRSGDFPNLGVNPMSCQGNMPSGPVGASLGGLTPQAAQIQEVMAMLGSMSEGQLQTVQQHVQDRFVTMQQRRGVPEVFGDGLGRAADSSFVTPQPFDVLPGFGVQQSNHGNSQQLDVFAKSEKWLTPAPTPVGTWKTREEEVLGWAGYLDELSSWAAGGSLEFSVENPA